MTAKLRLSDDFSLPLEVAGEATAIIATRGAGKSFASAVLTEELFDAQVQVVVIDPTGVYWGLRGSGDKEGLPIYVFGGQHGDLPLEPTAGAIFADLAVDDGHSFVLDLSSFGTKGEQTRFMRAFAERLYRRKAQHRSTLHLIIDEADEFAPQKPLGSDAPHLLGAMEQIVRRGRSRGLGCTLLTQRSAVLNKNVLDVVETLIMMRTVGPRDRKAVEGWVSVHEQSDELGVLDSLPSLRTGTAWVWSPVRDILQQIEVRRIRTFDSYRTPKPGEIPAKPRAMAEIDLDDLGKRMSATVERAKAADPRALRNRIAELERQLAVKPRIEKPQDVIVEVPVLSESEFGELEAMIQTLRDSAALIIEPVIAKADEMMIALGERRRTDARDIRAVGAGAVRASERPPTQEQVHSNGFSPTVPQKRILDAASWLESMGIEGERQRLGWASSYSPQSGNFNNLLSELNTAGAITYPRPGVVALTDLGSSLADHPDRPLTSGEIHERVMAKLKPAWQRVFQAVLDIYPEDITREQLADRTGYTQSGNFNNILSKLSSMGVLIRSVPGSVRAAEFLFIN